MKRIISTLALAFASLGAFAQLQAGSVAPNFTLTDINGTTWDLYTILNSGKTVFLDVSAAWCGPCWSYHNSGALENLYKNHGPTGASGVNATTTNDIMVLYVEGESTNTTAQLHGTSSGTAHSTYSQGDWVTGTPYPIIDPAAAAATSFDAAWNIGYFPTIYMVCRDHLVREVGQLTEAALYAQSQAICPTYAPSNGDVKALAYSSKNYFVCNNIAATVTFISYSPTPITLATVDIYSGATKVGTQSWTGNVAPYGVGTINITSSAFTTAPTAFAPYKYIINVTGDAHTADNASKDSIFALYTASTAVATPWKENFEASANVPAKMTMSGTAIGMFQTVGSYTLKGIDGNTTRGLKIGFPEVSAKGTVLEAVLGNFNTGTATNVALEFDIAHANASGYVDKVEIKVSNDCGATWATPYSKSGAALSTTAPPASGAFVPTAANQWRHETVLLSASKGSNMVLKVVGTADLGHYAFMDNIKISNTTGVENVINNGTVNLYPNPAKESATLEFTLNKGGKVVVKVLDAVGRTVTAVVDATMAQGAQRLTIPTATMAAGVYNITIQTEEGTLTQRLSVVK